MTTTTAHTTTEVALAAVSPVLIQAYRDGALTLDHLTAFALTEDRDAQERVYGQLQDWQRTPDLIRHDELADERTICPRTWRPSWTPSRKR